MALISDIQIGDRVRQDMGDLRGLAESIEKNGLLHPVVVTSGGLLVAGHRRLEAVKLLGWAEVPVTVVDVADLLSAERDENEERKDFTPTEAVAIGRLIEERHRERIAEQLHDQRVKANAIKAAKASGDSIKLIQLGGELPALGQTREVAAKAVGMGASKYDRAKAVVSAAEADPERFGDLPAKMDETGNVSGTYRELERRKADRPGGEAPSPESKPKPRHEIHGRARYPKPNEEMQRGIVALEGICLALRDLDVKQLDPDRVPGWSMSLKDSTGFLAKLLRRMNGR